eukprot:TRINITY_DN29991_c0_g1_i1.p1 TRINITY_DN29991_c0_g1~~TRINITY_DN29991_c0_g1_i1.p1  ORF type:complete len:274 (+),score=53.42 TRINITY_DN29991_c0_g1_i1:115-822(+)
MGAGKAEGDPFYTEVARTAAYTVRTNGPLKTTTMIPRNNKFVTVHTASVTALEKLVKELDGGVEPHTKVKTVTDVWGEQKGLIESMNLIGTDWERRISDIVRSCDDDIEEMVTGVVETALAGLGKAKPLHDSVTANLKKLSQDAALLDCMVSLSRSPASYSAEIKSIRATAASTLIQLQTYTATTNGIPYTPDKLLTTLLGVPESQKEIMGYLKNLLEKYPDLNPPKFSDASASI